mmetsp:Transcript_62402/g.182357  ORF Transcript_62402/g.182357 Transcript_62402/m.182357 type:complete len:116 (-) Transcript_62402:20-367(-)
MARLGGKRRNLWNSGLKRPGTRLCVPYHQAAEREVLALQWAVVQWAKMQLLVGVASDPQAGVQAEAHPGVQQTVADRCRADVHQASVGTDWIRHDEVCNQISRALRRCQMYRTVS